MSETDERFRVFIPELDECPEDMSLRRICADWLDDVGDPRAEVIRQLVDFHEGETEELELSRPDLLWSSMRAFVRPTDRIRALSPFQKRLLPQWSEMWLRVALSTEETNEPAAEQAVIQTYQSVGLKPPSRFVWAMSPLEATRKAADIHNDLDWSFMENFAQPGDFWTRGKFDSKLFHRRKVQRPKAVQQKTYRRVNDIACGPVMVPTSRAIIRQLSDSESYHCEFSWDSKWLGTYEAAEAAESSFYHHVCGLIPKTDLTGQFLTVLHCGWWYPFQETVVISEKPMDLEIEDGRLIYVRYPDGFEATHADLDD